jgi:archaellum biogenesis ATPase FlaH
MRFSEQTLLGHLSDPDSLDYLAREGLLVAEAREIIPTDFVRRVTTWALERFFEDGRQVAPSREAVQESWGDQLEQLEIELPAPDVEIDSIGWVVEDLRSNYARIQGEKLGTDFATAMGTADGPARTQVFLDYADRFYHEAQALAHARGAPGRDLCLLLRVGRREELAGRSGDRFYHEAQALVSRRHEANGYEGVRDALTRLDDRMTNGYVDRGMHLGLDLVDQHMHGVHPGEICVFCSESGVGKSWLAGLATISEWRRGRKVLLVTMENDVEMTYDRLCCIACGIPYENLQTGEVSDEQLRVLFTLLDEMQASENRPVVAQIEPSQRTVSGIVRKAQLEGADSLIIDQLSFVKPEKGSKTQGRNFQVTDIMHQLKEMVNEGALKIPVLLLVQINREGAAAAAKAGRYYMRHLAESSSVEQTADFVWALFQSMDMKIENTVQAQSLKVRRVVQKHFEFSWMPAIGIVHGMGEIDIDRQAT